jgi:glycosyltransferase involved in cell wall biosynthesis
MKKKLLVFHPIIAPYRIDFFNSLSEQYDITFCMFQKNLTSQKFDYEKLSQSFKFKPQILDQLYHIPYLKIRKKIISTIRETNPDIILVPECGYVSIIIALYKIILRKKYKVISIIDDSYDMLINNNQFSKKHALGEKVLIPLFDDIINVEPRVVSFFREKYGKGIYFPIIQDEKRIRYIYQSTLPISQQYIEQYNLQNKKIILFVGRLVALKNIKLAIKTFNKITLTNISLVIVGNGETENELKQLANNNSNIIFTGRLEGKSLYAWYNIAEIFILPSTQEPFGAVTNEALIGGCFCLISNKAGSNCLIKDGKNGYIFDPYNEIEFKTKLEKALTKIPLRSYPLQLRENKMPYSYQYYIKSAIQSIDK